MLDDLVTGHRDEQLDSLCRFLGIEPDDGLRSFFDGEMSAAGMHRGRWAEGAGTLGRARVIRRYERTLSTLAQEDNHVAGPLREVLERLG